MYTLLYIKINMKPESSLIPVSITTLRFHFLPTHPGKTDRFCFLSITFAHGTEDNPLTPLTNMSSRR